MYNSQYDLNGDPGTAANEYGWMVLLVVVAACLLCVLFKPKADPRRDTRDEE